MSSSSVDVPGTEPLRAPNGESADCQDTTYRTTRSSTTSHETAPSTPTMTTRLSSDQLPVEILQEVFLRCLPALSNDDIHVISWHRNTRNSPEKAPLLLSHVCKRWRDIALSSPLLWTTLSVIIRSGDIVPAPELVSLWLSRSGALPLNLSLYQQNESTTNCVAASRILNIFRQYIFRWGDVRFELLGLHCSTLLAVKENAAPMLRRFQLRTSHMVSEDGERDLFGVFNHVPRLLSLHVSRIPDLDIFGGSSIPIPWTQLVRLSLEYVPTVGTALHILEKCQNLEVCTMKIDSIRGSLLYEPLRLPNLHTLSVNLGFNYLAFLFDQLSLPQLVDLTISVRGSLERYGWAQEHFTMFLTRSNCRIRRLEMHDTGMNSLEFATCLLHPSLQSLTELVIDDTRDWTWDPFVTHAALDLLTAPVFHDQRLFQGRSMREDNKVIPNGSLGIHSDTSPIGRYIQETKCYLPLLRKLTVRGSCFLSPDGMIADMVESRWKHHGEDIARLKLVDIELPLDHIEDMRRLKELQREGLEVLLQEHH